MAGKVDPVMVVPNASRNIAADLLDLLDRPVITWRPDENSPTKIAGKVVSLTSSDGEFGVYPILDIDDGDTIWRVHALGTVFANELERQGILVGDVIGVSDLGRATVQNGKFKGKDYRNVRLVMRPRNHAPEPF